MERRKYTLAEIDEMRAAIKDTYPSGVPFYPAQRAVEIEAQLQTYMLNGTSPLELEARAAELRRQDQAFWAVEGRLRAPA